MGENRSKAVLIVVRQSPYGSSLGRTSLDAALAYAAFDQDVRLLFMGDGVLHLMPDQDSTSVGLRNIGKLLSSLPLYDIETVFVDGDAMQRYRMNELDTPVDTLPLDAGGIRDLIDGCDHVLGF